VVWLSEVVMTPIVLIRRKRRLGRMRQPSSDRG